MLGNPLSGLILDEHTMFCHDETKQARPAAIILRHEPRNFTCATAEQINRKCAERRFSLKSSCILLRNYFRPKARRQRALISCDEENVFSLQKHLYSRQSREGAFFPRREEGGGEDTCMLGSSLATQT